MPEPTDPAAAVLAEAAAAARVGLLPEAMIELFGEPIHVYTREQAIADGTLVDVSEHARTTYRYVWPVAITAAAWADTVAWDDATEARKPEFTGQDQTGRLNDVLWMARQAIRAADPNGQRLDFTVYRVPATGRGVRAKQTRLTIAISGGDNGEPVLTIMRPDED